MPNDSQIKRVLDAKKPTGAFVADERGYMRFEPTDEERVDLERWIATEHDLAEEECRPIYEEAAENMATYKASKISAMIDGEAAIMPAPLAKIAVDQFVAWEYNTILRPRHIVSTQPSFADTYEVVVPIPKSHPSYAEMQARMVEMGIDPSNVAVTVERSAEEVGQYLQAGYDHKLRDRDSINYPSLLRDALNDLAIVGKCYGKIYRDKSERAVFRPKKRGGAIIDLRATEEEYVADGDQIHWCILPIFNILTRIHDDEHIDKKEWLSERTPCSKDAFLGRWHSGEFPLIETEEDAEKLAGLVGEVKPEAQKDVEATTQNRYSLLPPNQIDLRLVWFHRYVRYKDESGQVVVRRLSLMGDYHHGARRMLNFYRNPRNDQRRPYAVGYQFKDPHCDSGGSLTSISKYFQRVATHASQAEIKNAFLASTFTPWTDPGSDVADEFAKQGGRLIPGKFVNGVYSKDWGVAPISQAHTSLVPFLTFIKGWAREAQNMSAVETGDSAGLGRTPSGTIAQLLEQGLQQPFMLLRGVDEFNARMMRLDLETRRQFQPLGEVIPTRDAKTKAMIDIVFRYPTGDAARNFRFSLTAVDEMLASENEPETLVMLHNLWQQHTQFIAGLAAAMKQATAAERQLLVRILDGAEQLFARIVALTRTDTEAFAMKNEIDAFQRELDELQAIAEQEGLLDGQGDQAAAAEGVQPGPAGDAVPAGPGGMAGEPSLPPDPGAPPQGGLPAEGVVE